MYISGHLDQELENVIERKNKKVKSCDLTEKTGRPIDDTVIDFFRISCGQLTTLQFFDVKEITLEDLRMTVGQCPQLEVLVFQECSIVPDWRSHSLGNHIKVISCSVDHLQMFGLQILPSQV